MVKSYLSLLIVRTLGAHEGSEKSNLLKNIQNVI